MGFHRPYRIRHLKSDPGVHTYPIVGWVLITLVGIVTGGFLFLVGAIFWISVRF